MQKVNQDEIWDLIQFAQEGSYWDYKREWYASDSKGKGDMLHDIICMANNLESRDGYIIIGVDEEQDFDVCGVDKDTNRRNTQNIVDFLRDKKFAGGIRPTVSVESMLLEDCEIDVMVVHSDRNTPYYLTERVLSVHPNNIYTRVQDSNTPINSTADFYHVEMLWKRRFGLDASIKEKFLILLDQYEEWEHHFDDMRATYHSKFPEFRIEVDYEDRSEGWEPQSPFYLDPKMYFTPLRLMYFNTIIFETGIIDVDGFRLYLPYSQERVLDINAFDAPSGMDGSVHYYYYNLSEMPGKLFKLMTSGNLNFSSRGIHDVWLYLVFENDDEHERFRDFSYSNYSQVDITSLKVKYKRPLSQIYDGNPMEIRILQLVIASELYKLWQEDEQELE